MIALLYLEVGWCSLVGLAIQSVFLTLGVICSRKYARMRYSFNELFEGGGYSIGLGAIKG